MLACALAGCGTIDRDDLAYDMQDLHSLAAEGALLAAQAHSHKDPKPFTWIESAELLDQAERMHKGLEGETVEPGLGPLVSDATGISMTLERQFELLHSRPDDPQLTGDVHAVLASVAHRTRDLDERFQ